MSDVVLLYDRDCPNVSAARENLLRAFDQAGAPARWVEVDRAGEDTPAAWRGFGSPTILVDGVDVGGGAPASGGPTCRLYPSASGFSGAPPVEALVAALAPGEPPTAAVWSWRRVMATAPGVGVALLPMLGCPACWPAYAGLLSAMGLGFLIQARYLLPLTIVFLALALGAIGWRAKSRHGYGPLLLGGVGSVVLLVGKFHFELDPAMWSGVAALVAASLWNAWPRPVPTVTSEACPACAPRADAASASRGA